MFSTQGEYVAHFKFTVLLMPNGPHRITGLPFEPELYQSQHAIRDPVLKVRIYIHTHKYMSMLNSLVLQSLLNSSANPKAAKKKKKKAETAAEPAVELEAAA